MKLSKNNTAVSPDKLKRAIARKDFFHAFWLTILIDGAVMIIILSGMK